MWFDELLACLPVCDAGLSAFWISSAMEMLMGSFKLILASRVTPKSQKMKNTCSSVRGVAGERDDTVTKNELTQLY